VNGLKTRDSWDMCLCSVQTRSSEIWNLPTTPLFQTSKTKCVLSKGLSVTAIVKETGRPMWCREPKECRHDILLMLVSQSQLIVVFCDCFTKSVNCHVLRLFLVTYDNLWHLLFLPINNKAHSLTHWGHPPFSFVVPFLQFSAAAAAATTTTDIGSW
jgi:hypothetical protein